MPSIRPLPLIVTTVFSLLIGCAPDSESTVGSPTPEREIAANTESSDTATNTEKQSSDKADNTGPNLSPEQQIRDKIAHGIKLLKEERFKEFGLSFMKPTASHDSIQVQKRTEALSNGGLADLMIEAFQSTSEKEAVTSSDGTVSFALDKPLGAVKQIDFCEIDGDWYLVD